MEPVCVIGMHRSGTSCLTGILQAAGLHLGSVFTCNPHNARGNRENASVVELNDAVLNLNGLAWDKPGQITHWLDEHRLQRHDLLERLQSNTLAGSRFGFKDPRTLLTLPFWCESGPIQFIATFRHPLAVARSLALRDGMPHAKALALWRRYNSTLLERHHQEPFPLINYCAERRDYEMQVYRALGRLGFSTAQIETGLSFYTESLRHETVKTADKGMDAATGQIYAELLHLNESDKA